MTGTCSPLPPADIDEEWQDEPDLILLDFVEAMDAFGITPRQAVSFAIATLIAIYSGEFDTKH